MNTATKKDARWQERFDDIGRSVDTAVDIVDNPTIEEVIDWIQYSTTQEVKINFAQKCINLAPLDRTTAVFDIVKKTGFGTADVKKEIKIAEQEALILKQQAAIEAKSAERESRGIHELELTVENSGDIAEKVCKIIAKSDKKPQVYVMGGSLATIRIGHPKSIRQCHKFDTLGKDYPKMPLIQTYKKPFSSLSNRIKQDVMIIDNNGKDMDPPTRLLDVVGEAISPHFKPLTGIIEHPFIDANWKLVNKEGYNKRTGLYTILHHKLKVCHMKPEVAWKYLTEEVFAEFPFESDLDKAVAVAALMTAIADDTGFPGFGIVSPAQSSGKTTLAQLISYATYSRPIATTTLSDEEAELSKHLLAILQEGHSCVLFDNIKQGSLVTSDMLAKVMSDDTFSGRQLGENKTVEVPCSSIWLFTGNGIKFVGDFATRVFPITINPKMEAPDQRVFKRQDIGQWAMDNRKKIISAVLSIIIEGKGLKPMDSGSRFKLWDKFVRRPLLKVSGIDINDAVRKNQIKTIKSKFIISLA